MRDWEYVASGTADMIRSSRLPFTAEFAVSAEFRAHNSING